MKFPQPIVLASRSPRRKLLLQEAGISVLVKPPTVDDGQLRADSQTPDEWVSAMAVLKALDVAQHISSEGQLQTGTILAADTVCVHRGEMFG